jgi:ankyrin repeat protein
MDFLTDPKIADEPVYFIVETQLLLRPYLEGRQAMHLLYKVCRADNPEALWNDFRSDVKIEPRSYDEVQKDALAELESLLETGKTVDLNGHNDDPRGATLLWKAAEQGHAAVVEKLLQQPNIDPNQVRTQTKTTPLHIAVHHGHVEIVKAILGHQQVEVNSGNIGTQMSPLNDAVQLGREEVVEVLLGAKDIDVNHTVMSTGVSPLIEACELNHEHIAKLLLASRDIEVNHAHNNGSTALSIATHKNQDEIRKMLLAHPGIDSSTANLQPQSRADVEGKGPVEAGTGVGDNTSSCGENAPVLTAALDATSEQGTAVFKTENVFSASELLAIATQLSTKVEIKERALPSRACPPCFVGSEAVMALIELDYVDTSAEAELLGGELIRANMIKPVVGEHGFKNQQQLFYVFSDLGIFSSDVGSSSAASEDTQVRPPASTSEVPAVHVGGTKELRPKVESKTFKLSSIDRNLESSLKEQALLEKLSAEVPAANVGGVMKDPGLKAKRQFSTRKLSQL